MNKEIEEELTFLRWWYENAARCTNQLIEDVLRVELKNAYEKTTGNEVPEKYREK